MNWIVLEGCNRAKIKKSSPFSTAPPRCEPEGVNCAGTVLMSSMQQCSITGTGFELVKAPSINLAGGNLHCVALSNGRGRDSFTP